MSWSGELAPGLAWPTITGSAHYLPYLAEATAKQPVGASAKCSPDKGVRPHKKNADAEAQVPSRGRQLEGKQS
ncbi:hypothetical protein GW17_00034673 [Ensete ventricosum]|nr:hypothetical protein GW17_00034673 [Ensete ventricosum]